MPNIETEGSLFRRSEMSLEELIEKDNFLKSVYEFGKKAHEGQFRKDGVTPYFEHCVSVARIIYEEWGIESPTHTAVGLLHDSVEDTKVTLDEIEMRFGKELAFGVASVTDFEPEKATILIKSKAETDTDNVRKVFAGTLINPVVAIYKLADRLANMRTLEPIRPEKQVYTATQTLNAYAPLAESLGIWVVKRELENISMRYSDPRNFAYYMNLIKEDPRASDLFVSYMKSLISTKLHSEGVEATVSHRINSIAMLKNKSKTRLFRDIDDVVSFRVVIDDDNPRRARDESLKSLGILWEEFGKYEDLGRFDNFFFQGRDNNYSAFQMTLNFDIGAVRLVVTTKEKEDYNSWGIISLLKKGKTDLREYALKLVFTPTGEVRFFPPTANGLDFAYNIDDQLGAQASGMLINGSLAEITSVIPNGATVEILVGDDRLAPTHEVVNYVLPKTKRKIRKQFIEQAMEEQQAKGRRVVEVIIKERGLLNLYDLLQLKEHSGKVVGMLFRLGAKRSLAKLYQSIGSGVINPADFVQELDRNGITKKDLGLTSVYIDGIDKSGLLNTFSSIIGRLGGNIRRNYGESNENKFNEHFVIEGLTAEKERELVKSLEAEKLIGNFEVV